jgi:hypothetical protein
MDETKRSRILASLTRDPSRSDSGIAKNLSVSVFDVREVRAGMSGASPDPVEPRGISGITLTQRRVLSRRPAESAAKFIKRLANNKGFHPSDLAREWGMSEETIRKHAREMGCLKFVEVTEDEWKPLIMSPETAARYPS